MKPTSILDAKLHSLHAAGLILAAVALTATSAVASTAANTVITNTATVNYNDAGGVAQPAVNASVAVTVTLVPSAVTLSSPPNQIIAQGSTATLSYTITSNANGQDTYNLSSVVTATNLSAVTPALPANITLGGTTLAVAANIGDGSITVPYDNSGLATINGIGAGSFIIIGGNQYTVGTVTKNAAVNTAVLTLTSPVAGSGQAIGTVVGERKTFTETVPSGTVTSGSSGSQSVATSATSTTAPGPATTQTTPTIITVQRPTLTVTKLVSTDSGATFNATGTAPPGTVLIYKITASNTAATNATSVAFTDVLPAYLTYQTGTGKFTNVATTGYSGATGLTEGSGGYAVAGSTVTYSPPGAAGTVPGGGVLILYFGAKIN